MSIGNDKRSVELLAPAGSFECLKTAINAGCDAIYVGGTSFSARAFANNFSREDMIRAIKYAHLYGKKLYITINTLLKDNEIEQLRDYLMPYYETGCDAVIVQDVGVIKYVHENFKDLPIHASTQMTLMTDLSANMLKDYGVERIVTPRELSLYEIKRIRENTKLEIETFIHGALCYCYSGQCMMSSMIGSRSGNRGRCAQPCRKEYSVGNKKSYILSTKDMCSLELVPDMIKAGIDSFKIEGRMKKPEYVAAVVNTYRKYIDLYMETGKKGTNDEIKEDVEKLMDIYNRGGFNKGYFYKHNGKEMMSLDRPNHYGVPVGKVLNVVKNKCTIKLNKKINGKDVLQIRANNKSRSDSYEFTLKDMEYNEKNITTRFNKELNIKKDQLVYRIRNQKWIDKLYSNYVNCNKKILVSGYFIAKKGEKVEFKLVTSGKKTECVCTGDIVETASNAPVTKERIKKQIAKFGDTKFELSNLEIDIDDDIFVPMGKLNELRRRAVSDLENKIISLYYRSYNKKDVYNLEKDKEKNEKMVNIEKKNDIIYTVLINKKETVDLILEYDQVKRIYIETYDILSNEIDEIICNIHKVGKEVYIALPHILRYDNAEKFKEEYGDVLKKCDGCLVRNIEGIYISKIYNKQIILDYNMYTCNSYAKSFWGDLKVCEHTASLELSKDEIESMLDNKAEMLVYGYIEVMLSAQCVNKNTNKCDKKTSILYLKDTYKESYFVKNVCKYCYNIIYSSQPIFVNEDIKNKTLRISFTKEKNIQAKDILDCIIKNKDVNVLGIKGHYRKTVD